MQQTVLLLAAMHAMNPGHIHEELELMRPDFASYIFEWISTSPRWRDHYCPNDQTPHYEYMRDVLKLLQWRRGPYRWVLKCRQHLEQLPVLQQIFPGATIVMTHRNPVAVIQSAVTMIADGQRVYRRKTCLHSLIDYWTDRVEHLLQVCVRDRQSLPAASSIDILFHQFMANGTGTIEDIYANADIELTVKARSEMEHFMENNPWGKQRQVVYHLKNDFGVSPDALRERFSFYFDHFPVESETI